LWTRLPIRVSATSGSGSREGAAKPNWGRIDSRGATGCQLDGAALSTVRRNENIMCGCACPAVHARIHIRATFRPARGKNSAAGWMGPRPAGQQSLSSHCCQPRAVSKHTPIHSMHSKGDSQRRGQGRDSFDGTNVSLLPHSKTVRRWGLIRRWMFLVAANWHNGPMGLAIQSRLPPHFASPQGPIGKEPQIARC